MDRIHMDQEALQRGAWEVGERAGDVAHGRSVPASHERLFLFGVLHDLRLTDNSEGLRPQNAALLTR